MMSDGRMAIPAKRSGVRKVMRRKLYSMSFLLQYWLPLNEC